MPLETFVVILLLGVVSHACRLGGFFLMRYVALTPRVEAWLGAIPVALIGAIIGPIAFTGGPPEWLGLATALALMRYTSNDFVSVIAACAVVAGARALGL
jgi:uncharacterized membrane protein